jgi:Thiol:disulfide interchange protein DsbD, N-terminal
MTRTAHFELGVLLFLTACGAKPDLQSGSPYPLASLTENRVTVEVALAWDESGQTWLEAAFTPEEGYHLYSKDIPRGGVDGLGRPTLLELVPGSRLVSTGDLTESVGAYEDEDCEGLLAYPEGSVTLRLPVRLPEGRGWFEEQVSITFMACRAGTCCPPAAGRLIPVRVPGAEELKGP